MFTRARYQRGCLTREQRKGGPDVWIFRYREETPDGRVNRKKVIGTVEQYRTKASAMKEADLIRVNINKETPQPARVADLIAHYLQKELPEQNGQKAYSTRHVYTSYIKTWILPAWGERALGNVKTVAVEEWLGGLPLAPASRAKIRNIMSAIFNHAMRYEWTVKNPITLVRQSAKRQRVPDVLTVDEIKALLAELKDPFKTMVFLAASTGLRISELLALKWQDINSEAEEITLSRAIVHQVVGEMKTEASRKPIPLDPDLAYELLRWRSRSAYNQDGDYVFASVDMKGTQPYWPDSALRRVVRPACVRAGINKRVGWHTFRHTYGTLLKANGEDVKTVQESLRHANSRITLDIYTQALTPLKRAAQRKVVEMFRTQTVGA